MIPANGDDLWRSIQVAARELGLDRVAVADPRRKPDPAALDGFLAEGRQAGMDYLARHREVRLDPERMLPGVRSILCAAVSYRSPSAQEPAAGRREDTTAAADTTTTTSAADADPAAVPARIASYAVGEDYHRVLKEKLHGVLAAIRGLAPGVRGRVAVDTAPVLERHWAREAGLGWIGRHGCLIVPGLGSFVLLGELFLDVPLPAGDPGEARCGTCRRCLEACPTGALVAPGRLDARRCVSYWTVEHRGDFPSWAPPIAPWAFGCDRCQEVCPWNRHAPAAACRQLREPLVPARTDARRLRAVRPEAFERLWARTAMERTGWEGLQRNARRLIAEAAQASSGPDDREEP